MSFWTKTSLEPKRQYRFRLTIEKVAGSSAIWYAKKVTIPSFQLERLNILLSIRLFTSPEELNGMQQSVLWLTLYNLMQYT